MTSESTPAADMRESQIKPRISNSAVLTACVAILTVIATLYAAKAMVNILMPIIFAWIFSTMLVPFVNLLNRKCRIPYPLAVAIAMVITLFVIYEIGLFLNGILSSFLAKKADYLAKLKTLISQFFALLPSQIADELQQMDWIGKISTAALKASGKVFSFSSTLCMTLIIATFFFFEQRDIGIKLIAAFHPKEAKRLDSVLTKTAQQVSRYLILQFLISAITGIAIWAALAILRIDFAPTWGILAFICNFIPTIGSIVASVPPVLTALVQYAPETYWPAVITALTILVIQMSIGNFLAPRVLGDNLNIAPAVIIVSLMFWGWIWGIPGALISVPITASIKIVCDSFEALRPIGILLGSGKVLRAEQKKGKKEGRGKSRHFRHFRKRDVKRNDPIS